MRIVGAPNTRPTFSKRILLAVELSKRALAKKRQIIVIKHNFESVLMNAQGGRLETYAVQRPIMVVLTVSEGRSPRLNHFETKRKKAPRGCVICFGKYKWRCCGTPVWFPQ